MCAAQTQEYSFRQVIAEAAWQMAGGMLSEIFNMSRFTLGFSFLLSRINQLELGATLSNFQTF